MTEKEKTDRAMKLDFGATPKEAITSFTRLLAHSPPNFLLGEIIKAEVQDLKTITSNDEKDIEVCINIIKQYGKITSKAMSWYILLYYDEILPKQKKLLDFFDNTAAMPILIDMVGIIYSLAVGGLGFQPLYESLLGDRITFDKSLELFKKNYKDFLGKSDSLISKHRLVASYCLDYLSKAIDCKKEIQKLTSKLIAYRDVFWGTENSNEFEKSLAGLDMIKKAFNEVLDERLEQQDTKIAIKRAVEIFDVTRATLNRAIKEERIKTYRVKGGKSTHLLRRSDLAGLYTKREIVE